MADARPKEMALDSGSLCYREKGSGRPFILLNGFPFGSAEYTDVLEALSWSSRAVAVDLPGIAGSTPLAAPTPAALADAVLFSLSKFGIDCFVLAASDVAGPVAMEILDRQPGMVSAALFFNAIARPEGTAVPEYLVSGKTALFDLFHTRARTENEIVKVMGRADRLTPEALAVAEANLGHGGRKRGQALFQAAMKAPFHRYQEALSRFRKPLRLLWGERDPVCPPSHYRAFREAFPEARAASDPETGHFFGLEAPNLLAQTLQELGRAAWC